MKRLGGVTLPLAAAATFCSNGAKSAPPTPSDKPLRQLRRLSFSFVNMFIYDSFVSGKALAAVY